MKTKTNPTSYSLVIYLLCVSIAVGKAQQIDLTGQVSIHNSRYRTGEIEYVADASVQAPFAGETSSNDEGVFQLTFTGLEKGSQTALTIEKTGLEVVNERDLLYVTLGRATPLAVYLAPKGELAQRQSDFYKVSLAALTTRHDVLIDSLRMGRSISDQLIEKLEQQLNREIAHRYEAEDLLREQLEAAQERLPEMAQQLAQVNLDFTSDIYRRAYESYLSGDVSAALTTLDEAELANQSEGIITALASIERDKQDYQLAIEQEEEKARQVYESYALKADAYSLVFDYRSAVEVLRKGVTLLEVVKTEEDLELADAYREIGIRLQDLGAFEESLIFNQKSTGLKARLLPKNDPDLAISYNNLASIYQTLGVYDKALIAQQKDIAIVEQALQPNGPSLAISYNNLASIYQSLGEYPKALDTQQKALAIRAISFQADHPSMAISYNNLATIYQDLGQYSEALQAQQKDISIIESVLEPEHPSIAASYHNLSSIYQNLGNYSEALAAQQKNIAIIEKVLEPDHPSLATSYSNLALIYKALGTYDTALTIQQKALVIQERVLPPNHPETAISYNNLALIYKELGEYETALTFQQQGIVIMTQVFGPNHPALATSYNNLALIYKDLGEYEKALVAQQQDIAISELALAPDHPGIAVSYNNLAIIYQALDQYEQALAAQQRAIEILAQVLSSDHPKMAASYNNLASIYQDLGDYHKALAMQQKNISITEKVLGPVHPDLATSYSNLASIYSDMGDYENALAVQKKDISIIEQVLNADHPSIATSYNNLASIYFANEQLDSSLIYMEKAYSILRVKLSVSHPNLVLFRENLSYLYSERGTQRRKEKQFKAAISDFQNALELSVDQGELFKEIGQTYFFDKNYELAIENFTKSYQLNGLKETIYLNHIGLSYTKWGKLSEAHESFSRLEKLLPNNYLPYRNWCIYYILSNKPEAALDHLEKAFHLGYNNWEWLETGTVLDPLRDHPRFQALMEQAPDTNN